MSEREFAGFRYADRIYTSFYGPVFEGVAARDGGPVRVLRVDARWARVDGFAKSVEHYGRAFALLRDDNLIGTRAAGVDGDGTIVVVTEAFPDSVSLDAIVERLGGRIEAPVALGIAMAASKAMAYLHGAGLCHGALQPGSIRIDVHGQVRLDDAVVGRALAEAAASNSELLSGFAEFVSPEVLSGAPTSPASDVFALASVLGSLASYHTAIGATLSIAKTVVAASRPADGNAFRQSLSSALKSSGVKLADREELGRLARETAEDDSVDLATEGLVADLMAGHPAQGPSRSFAKMESSVPAELSSAAQPVPALDQALDSLIQGSPDSGSLPLLPDDDDEPPRRFPRLGPKPVMPQESRESESIRRARLIAREGPPSGESVEPETGEVTAVDDVDALLMQTDPISEIIKLGPMDDEGGEPDGIDELPTNAISRRSVSERLPVRADEAPAVEAPVPVAKPPIDVERSAAAASDALASLGETSDFDAIDRSPAPAKGIEPVQSVPEPRPRELSDNVAFKVPNEDRSVAAIPEPLDDFGGTGQLRRKGSGLWWMIAATITVGSSFGYVYTQTDLFHPERAKAKKERAQRERDAEEARLRAQQDQPGTMLVDASEEEAAVWLMLGRAPLDTFALPASSTQDLRFELDGHKPMDLAVTGPMWTGEGPSLKAAIHARLEAGEASAELPAFPKPPAAEPPPGPEGQGRIRVESTPTGAKVWLLVGFTPEVLVSGLAAGKTYQFKVLKEGFEPATVSFDAREWYLSGEAGVGKVRPQLSRKVELVAKPKGDKSGRPKGKKRGR